MATKDRRVVFARINRRQPRQDVLSMRAFAEDMRDLAASRLTRHQIKSTAERPGRTWSAADMTLDPSGDFMTGVLGYSTQEQHVEFDNDAWSWVKAQPRDSDAATPSTVAPFAVDLRNHERWVGFIPAPRVQASSFCSGLEMVLNEAVSALGLMPEAWEVDLVTSRSRVDEWLRAHPRVYLLTRTVKFTNPGLDLDNDRSQMRALHANRKTEEFAAAYGGHLDMRATYSAVSSTALRLATWSCVWKRGVGRASRA